MENTKILYVTQDLDPYTSLSEIAEIARELPKYAHNNGMEIRILMPKFGTINDRRHRLHEVVRLSGINIIIDDDDFPLIIKVASLPGARLQVYFLDNDDFFNRKSVFTDSDDKFFEDNAERMIFFNKGVIETVRKFGWAPDIVHCHGWMTSLIPFYLKTGYKQEPIFQNSKVVYSVYNNDFEGKLSDNFINKATSINKQIDKEEFIYFNESSNEGLDKGAIEFSDAVIIAGDQVNGSVREMLDTIKKPKLELSNDEDYLSKYKAFYEEIL
jgi:starch synthase